MQTTDQSNERLHQQASALYLQGKFDEALSTWKRILASDPEDERATEGVRLCELLTEDATIVVEATDEALPETAKSDAPAAEESLEFELPFLELDLPETDIPDPQRQSEGIDFGSEPDALRIDGDIPEVPAPSDVAPIVEGIFDVDTPTDTVDGANQSGANELTLRVRDLLAEARAAHENGDIEAASSVLKRVFILDETNAAALELQEQIENGVPPVTEQVDVADLDAPDHDAAPGDFDLAADSPDAPDTVELDTASLAGIDVEAPTPEAFDAPVEDDFPDFDVDSEFQDTDDDLELETEADEQAKGRIKLPQIDAGSSKTRWIVIGVVVGLFVVVGVGFWMRLRSIDVREVPPPIARPAETASEPVAEPQPAEVEAPPVVENVAPTEDVATLLERGNKAMAEGNYSAAILAFDALLKQEPGHIEANGRMEEATEAYRLEQETQKEWIAAASLFRDGEYRAALAMFYRLPADNEKDRSRLDRYKENGWFNMGLLALRSAQCDRALEHFSEASQVDSDDPDIAMALALCETCEGGGARKAGFQRAVAAMKMRRLED